MILSIALRDLRSMFLSPLAWTVLAVTQLILAWSFFTQIDFFFSIQPQLTTMPNAPGVTDLVVMPTFEIASIILLMVTPLLTMRLISEERRNGTISLLLSSPVSMSQIVLGKFLGIVLFMLIFIAMISMMPLSLLMGTELDLGKFAAGVFGHSPAGLSNPLDEPKGERQDPAPPGSPLLPCLQVHLHHRVVGLDPPGQPVDPFPATAFGRLSRQTNGKCVNHL